jgi:hypothetical protein
MGSFTRTPERTESSAKFSSSLGSSPFARNSLAPVRSFSKRASWASESISWSITDSPSNASLQ